MKLSPQQVTWLKGAEVAIVGAVVSAVFEDLKSGGLPHDKAGWLKFAGVVGAAAYGAARLYLTKSPLQLPTGGNTL